MAKKAEQPKMPLSNYQQLGISLFYESKTKSGKYKPKRTKKHARKQSKPLGRNKIKRKINRKLSLLTHQSIQHRFIGSVD